MKQEKILREIEARLGEGYSVEAKEQKKNNGVVLHGIIVKKEGDCISPQFYIDGVEEDKIVDYVVDHYKEMVKRGDMPKQDEVKSMITKENILSKVFPALVNREKNMDRIENDKIVHKPYLDMELMYKFPVGNDGFITITKDILEHIEATEDELDYAAVSNVQFKAELKSIFDMLPMMKDDAPEDAPTMLIVSNKEGGLGAGMILDEGLIEHLSEELGDFYVIPSSIHELIVVPESAGEPEGLRKMVRGVNETLNEQEVLSDNVYICRDCKLEVA